MVNNNLYYWEQINITSPRKLLGEVQIGENGFNMSFVIDGTKDSAKFIVWSYSLSEALKPLTLVYHENTDTYWIVSNDKVEKRANESGWLYVHNLQLEGAIELLNARDLTDCGFNQKTYTIENFLKRLFKLSTFEMTPSLVFFNGFSKDDIVDYNKAFENYTLLSALREFLDGYNCCAKMRFSFNTNISTYPLQYAFIDILPKTGRDATTIRDIDETFTDVKEIKTLNKNSYGTTVISNAENIVSTKKKVYPSVGLTRISGEQFYIKPENACIRLPSKVNSVDYVDVVKGKIPVGIGVSISSYQGLIGYKTFDSSNIQSYDAMIDWIKTTLLNDQYAGDYVENNIPQEFWDSNKGQDAFNNVVNNFSFRFYDTEQYDPIKDNFISSHTINKFTKSLEAGNPKPYVLGASDIRNGVQNVWEVMYWERGSNLIKGFDFFKENGTSNQIFSTTQEGITFLDFDVGTSQGTRHYRVVIGDYTQVGGIAPTKVSLSLLTSYFSIKYTPMSDMKIKYDNTNSGNDIKLYNQNGRYTDGVALSKLLLSYKNEIVSDNITRYLIGYDYYSLPQVGDLILKNNEKYVINNVSLDFFQNEDGNPSNSEDEYFIVGEYTLSKNTSTKSLLTNPNTNIRDYGIPQNFNIQRKQLYRDFYELDFTQDTSADLDEYLPLNKLFNTKYWYNEYLGHTAVMKIVYDNPYGGGGEDYDGGIVQPSNTWYYQLDTTVYFMKKSMYEIIDFQDNNILGYDCQNVTCGFDIRRIFNIIQVGTANIDIVNTPVSYVDDKGQFKNIYISMCSSEQLMDIYDEYIAEEETLLSLTYGGTLYNRCVFIPSDIYNKAHNNCDFEINVLNYNKDALEVPMFEYSCQIDDTDNIIIGENIFENYEDDFRYFYELVFIPHDLVDNNNWKNFIDEQNITYTSNTFTLNDTNESYRKNVNIIFADPMIQFYAYNNVDIKSNEQMFTRTGYINLKNKIDTLIEEEQFNGKVDIAIIRYTIKNDYTVSSSNVSNVQYDLLMVIRNAQDCPWNDSLGYLYIYKNHYKLK